MLLKIKIKILKFGKKFISFIIEIENFITNWVNYITIIEDKTIKILMEVKLKIIIVKIEFIINCLFIILL